jgi:SPFH domain / Band 7 family
MSHVMRGFTGRRRTGPPGRLPPGQYDVGDGFPLLSAGPPRTPWGVHIDRVEIKDVALPESMKRSMSRQAEAERERRARVISAEGELQASEKLALAAAAMSRHPAALQLRLRLLETVVHVASEKNSTLVLPFPVELLRFLESNTTRADAAVGSGQAAVEPSPAAGASATAMPTAVAPTPTTTAPSSTTAAPNPTMSTPTFWETPESAPRNGTPTNGSMH